MKVYKYLAEVSDQLEAAGFSQSEEDKPLRRWVNNEKGQWAWLCPLVITPGGKIESFYFTVCDIPIAQDEAQKCLS
jgi:hypothetical protein